MIPLIITLQISDQWEYLFENRTPLKSNTQWAFILCGGLDVIG